MSSGSCNYLLDDDPTMARSCGLRFLYEPPLDQFNIPEARTVDGDLVCGAQFDSTEHDGDGWSARGPAALTCSWLGYAGGRPNVLEGPTFFKFGAAVKYRGLCPPHCSGSPAEVEFWVPMDGDLGPRAPFDVIPGDDVGKYTFDNTSIPFPGASYSWNFGPGLTSTVTSPTFTYTTPGTKLVVLTMSAPDGRTLTASRTVSGPDEIVVNSTGDASATDVTQGCDTGGTIAGVPECTLRAAIEVANERDGDTIEFDIEGTAVPAISLAKVLPAIKYDTTIDATTQEAGFVRVSGQTGPDAYLGTGLDVADGTLTVRGMNLDEFVRAINVRGGSEHVIEQNRLGTTSDGTTSGAMGSGVVMFDGTGTIIQDNVMTCSSACVQLGAGDDNDFENITIRRNRINVTLSDQPAFGNTGIITNVEATITDNTVFASTFAVLVQPAAENTSVSSNRIGTTHDGAVELDGCEAGVYVNAAPGVSVVDNRFAGCRDAIVVSGADQTERDGEDFTVRFPSLTGGDSLPGTFTGEGVTVSANIVNRLSGGTLSESLDIDAITLWAGAADVEVVDNEIVAWSGLEVLGGSGHRIFGNHFSSSDDPLDPDESSGRNGIEVVRADDVVIGSQSMPNTFERLVTAVTVGVESSEVVVDGNSIESKFGVNAQATRPDDRISGLRVFSNTLTVQQTGVNLVGYVADAEVRGNTISGAAIAGISDQSESTELVVAGNTVSESAVGIVIRGEDASVTGNRLRASGTSRASTVW